MEMSAAVMIAVPLEIGNECSVLSSLHSLSGNGP
jgi:hypothetical protein